MGERMARDLEALEVMERLERAIDDGLPVTITFMKQLRDRITRHPVLFSNGRPYMVKVRRTVEPYAVEFTREGHPVAYVVDRSPNDEKGPMYRTIRLDRVVVSTPSNRLRVVVHSKGKRYCQGLIDLALKKREERALAAH